MEEMDIKKQIKDISAIIDKYLLENIQGNTKNLWNAALHLIKAGGKRLRPFLLIKSSQLFDNDYVDLIPIASAIEILHTFTLIHDDIMDNDPIRRGVPTIHTKWNESIAILSGDLLYALSFQFVNQSNLSYEIKSKISTELAKVGIDLCEGQTMDMEFELRNDVSVEEYFKMIELKTGALFKTSVKIAALISNSSQEQIEALENYALNLGIAFQIVDDILGLIGEEKQFGKPIGSDLREGKKTFLLLYALENLEKIKKQKLHQILRKNEKNEEDIKMAMELISSTNAIKIAEEKSKEFIQKSIDSISIFPKTKIRDELVEIAQMAINRSK